jgi:hypothetical protein
MEGVSSRHQVDMSRRHTVTMNLCSERRTPSKARLAHRAMSDRIWAEIAQQKSKRRPGANTL